MPRKSPRSRKKPDRPERVPGSGRPRSKPGKGRSAERVTQRSSGTGRPEHRAATRLPAGARGLARKRAPRAPGAEASPESTRRVRRATAATPTGATGRARPAAPATGAARARPKPAPRRGRWKPPDAERVQAVLGILERLYPEATTALNHGNPLQLLLATILSAQCTDERVNLVTPALFARYPDAKAIAEARREDLEAMVRSTGFFRNKARAIQECCAGILAKHGGQVPRTLEELTALKGVGRKTANVVLGNAYGIPGLVVDTHVSRLSKRLGFTREADPVKIEFALMSIVPRETWTKFSHWLILHGRRICVARKPRCSICPLLPHCPRIGVTTSQ